jgi:cysteine desulfurase
MVIYLDNNATTKIDPRVLEGMMPYLTDNFANANSTHQFGLGANEAVKNARQQIATLIGCETNEIVFTSGATEGINLAIKGIAENYNTKGKHIITVSTEHSAILDTCKYLEKKGFEITYLPVDKDGLIDLQFLKKAIRPETISVMLVNNETGVIQNIKEISDIAHSNDVLFMTDATQAVGKINIDVEALQIDLMPFSGHKIYGPKGVGALYVRQRRPRKIKMEALQHGGGHEKGWRSGTLNVPGIVGLGLACEIAEK